MLSAVKTSSHDCTSFVLIQEWPYLLLGFCLSITTKLLASYSALQGTDFTW